MIPPIRGPNSSEAPVHCVQISKDGFVYVCDRGGDRIQVFTKQGKFVKEFIVANQTLERGSVGSVSFFAGPAAEVHVHFRHHE